MKQITTLFIMLALANALSAQVVQFQRTYDSTATERCWSVAQTSDGGYILAGQTNSAGAGSYDAYLIKTDGDGAVQWTRMYGGSGYDWARAVRQTSDGGYIVIGGTESSGNGLADIWIFKTSNIGIISWQRTVGSADGDSGNDIIQTSDGGYIATGFQTGDLNTNENACLVKLDGSGSVQWIHTYSVGDNNDHGYSVAQTTDGGYLLAGDNDNLIVIGALLIKTDASGNVQWANIYGGSEDHWINSVTALPTGGSVIAGATLFQSVSYNAWLAVLNPNGTQVWSNSYSGAGTDVCLWACTTSDGGYAMSGRSNSFSADYDAFLIKTDSSGGPEWSRRYGGTANEAANQVIQSSNTGYALAASSLSFGAGECAYFIKTDASGNTGCNQNIPSFLMTPFSAPVSNVVIIDSVLTNVAASSLSFASPSLVATPLCFTVGDDELVAGAESISVYPNPATGQFTIYNLQSTIERVEIYSSLGEKIFSQKMTAGNQQSEINIDASQWSDGIYFIRIKTEQGLTVKKLVKQ